jgi:hypothetical protein
MKLHQLALGGIGTARVKRFRRGMEKDWNRADEPLKRILTNVPRISKRFIKYRNKKYG